MTNRGLWMRKSISDADRDVLSSRAGEFGLRFDGDDTLSYAGNVDMAFRITGRAGSYDIEPVSSNDETECFMREYEADYSTYADSGMSILNRMRTVLNDCMERDFKMKKARATKFKVSFENAQFYGFEKDGCHVSNVTVNGPEYDMDPSIYGIAQGELGWWIDTDELFEKAREAFAPPEPTEPSDEEMDELGFDEHREAMREYNRVYDDWEREMDAFDAMLESLPLRIDSVDRVKSVSLSCKSDGWGAYDYDEFKDTKLRLSVSIDVPGHGSVSSDVKDVEGTFYADEGIIDFMVSVVEEKEEDEDIMKQNRKMNKEWKDPYAIIGDLDTGEQFKTFDTKEDFEHYMENRMYPANWDWFDEAPPLSSGTRVFYVRVADRPAPWNNDRAVDWDLKPIRDYKPPVWKGRRSRKSCPVEDVLRNGEYIGGETNPDGDSVQFRMPNGEVKVLFLDRTFGDEVPSDDEIKDSCVGVGDIGENRWDVVKSDGGRARKSKRIDTHNPADVATPNGIRKGAEVWGSLTADQVNSIFELYYPLDIEEAIRVTGHIHDNAKEMLDIAKDGGSSKLYDVIQDYESMTYRAYDFLRGADVSSRALSNVLGGEWPGEVDKARKSRTKKAHRFQIYQVSRDDMMNNEDALNVWRDANMGYKYFREHNTNEDPWGHYSQIYDWDDDDDNLETVFYRFNMEIPSDFKGHSLSIGDIVVRDGEAYMVDTYGFTPVDFVAKTRKSKIDTHISKSCSGRAEKDGESTYIVEGYDNDGAVFSETFDSLDDANEFRRGKEAEGWSDDGGSWVMTPDAYKLVMGFHGIAKADDDDEAPKDTEAEPEGKPAEVPKEAPKDEDTEDDKGQPPSAPELFQKCCDTQDAKGLPGLMESEISKLAKGGDYRQMIDGYRRRGLIIKIHCADGDMYRFNTVRRSCRWEGSRLVGRGGGPQAPRTKPPSSASVPRRRNSLTNLRKKSHRRSTR